MQPLGVAFLVFALTFGSALLCQLYIGPRVPETHLNDKSKDVVKLGLGLTVAITSLVLGLITASEKSAFDATDVHVKQLSTDLILLDHVLDEYGKDAVAPRDVLRRYTAQALHETWPDAGRKPVIENAGSEDLLEEVEKDIRALVPSDVEHQELRANALSLYQSLSGLRWTIIQSTAGSVHPLLIVVIAVWLVVIFGSFGLYAPRNATVIISLLLSSLSIAGCIFLILEMDGAFDGLVRVPSWPMENALRHQSHLPGRITH